MPWYAGLSPRMLTLGYARIRLFRGALPPRAVLVDKSRSFFGVDRAEGASPGFAFEVCTFSVGQRAFHLQFLGLVVLEKRPLYKEEQADSTGA